MTSPGRSVGCFERKGGAHPSIVGQVVVKPDHEVAEELAMTRGQVEIVKIRGNDIQIGDIVHARPDEVEGWFEVAKVAALPSGMISVVDADETMGFLVERLGIVGLQVMMPLSTASHAPGPGDGPPTIAEVAESDRQAAEVLAEAEAAAAEAEAAAAPPEEEKPKSGLFS